MKAPSSMRLALYIPMITALVTISSCATNPVTGKKQLNFMSEQQEIAMGAEYDPVIISQYGLYQNEAIQKFIDEKGQEMARISHRPHLKFQFRILDSPIVNAFAVPGGYVYFTRGIMAHFNNEAEFAGVLGHEIGHVTARHSAQQQTKATLAQIAMIGGLVLSKEVRAFANEAQAAMQLLLMKYSRDHESQSDALGVEYSTKVGYDAREMADFFKTLKALSDDAGGSLPTFLSTHPDPADRYTHVGQLADEWQAKVPQSSYKINRESFLKMIDGIIYGEDPRQGYTESGVFYHPELKFQFPVPQGWDLLNSPSQVQMAPQDGQALMIFTLAEGSDPQAAASNTSSQLNLTVKSSKNVTVNGLQAVEVMSEQVSQDQSTGQQNVIQVQSLYIRYSNLIYVFHGVAAPANFSGYDAQFDKTMYGFRELKDQAKINVAPERIKLVSVKQNGTLGQALNSFNMPTNRHRELAILNGMDITDKVNAGDMIKIVTK